MARRQGAGLILEDLSGIRQSSRQRKDAKSDAGQNRDCYLPMLAIRFSTSSFGANPPRREPSLKYVVGVPLTP